MYKFLFLLLFLTSYVAAQTGQMEIGRRSHRSKIVAGIPGTYKDAGKWLFFRLSPNEPWQRIGVSGKRMKMVFTTYPGGTEDYHSYRSNKIASGWCIAGSLTCGVGATMSGLGWLLTSLAESFSDPEIHRDDRLGQLALAGFAGSIGLSVSGRFLRRKSDRYLQRAVEQYNGQHTSAAPIPQEPFRLCIRPSGNYGIGIAMGF